jgi:hypothetical protein
MGNLGDIIKRVFELAGAVNFFALILEYQNCRGKQQKYQREKEKYFSSE